MTFEDRTRAESFGALAEQYDRYRPTYPSELIDDVLVDRPSTSLDVGTGTGKAARLFAARGVDVLCVEPDARMAEIARSHGLTVEVSGFEEWDRQGRTFDLLTSAQAWHWVDPTRGAQRTAQALVPGGRVALFWNHGEVAGALRTALDDVYVAHGPDLENVRGPSNRPRDWMAFVLEPTPHRFEPVEAVTYRRELEYTTDEWLGLLPTHSDHAQLGDARLGRLLDALRVVIDREGGIVTLDVETTLLTTTRR